LIQNCSTVIVTFYFLLFNLIFYKLSHITTPIISYVSASVKKNVHERFSSQARAAMDQLAALPVPDELSTAMAARRKGCLPYPRVHP